MNAAELEQRILEVLAARPRRACFLSELRRAVGTDMPEGELEDAVARLTSASRLVVQHNFCADPHFADEDLRVVALTATGSPEDVEAALRSCERIWSRWMTSFLASHRCT